MPDRLTLGSNAQNNWKIFKQRWTSYKILAEVDNMNAAKQKATFLHCLDDDALEAFNAFQLPDAATVNEIITQFDNFIIGECNVTYERFIFNKRNQEEGETFDLFFADLKRLIKTCGYCDNCKASLLKDRIVLGINDEYVQRELLKKRDLTTEAAIDICKSNERAMHQNKSIRPEINKVQHCKNNDQSNRNKCKYCGQSHEYGIKHCPAYGKTCNNCSRKNHFASVCNSRQSSRNKINFINADEQEYENEDGTEQKPRAIEWINNVNDENNAKMVKCKMEINNQIVKFQIDTGSTVNILPVNFVKEMKIENTEIMLKTWNNKSYKPIGEKRVIVRNPKNGKNYNVNFVICENEFMPIMGLRASEQMNLIELKHKNFEQTNKIEVDQNAEVFKRKLGTLRGKHRLQIKENAQPYIMPDRRVSIAMKEKLKYELDELTKLGVIAPVEEPTEWLSQLVISKKSNGRLRLCIDAPHLNDVLLRERYILPTLDDTLHELGNSKVFSKTDLADGYWHIELEEESSLLTTFQTCFGRFRWLRLPFGICTSAEIFQKKLHNALRDLKGVICVADDIIIHGRDNTEHDENMNKFLQRCLKEGIKLNEKKTFTKVETIAFMGHRITKEGLKIDDEKMKAINEFPRPTSITQLRSFLGMVNFLGKFLSLIHI